MTNQPRILIVEDEANIVNFLSAILSANGYEVLSAQNGTQALMQISSFCPDAVILDLGLPDIDGLKVIRSVREWSAVPILVVSARMHEKDKIAALDLGADDYITKPFSTGELLARIRLALRHVARQTSDGPAITAYRCENLMVDFSKGRAFLDGKDVHLTQIEYKILALMCRHSGRVLTYDFIISDVWGQASTFDHQILRVNMANIRRKIELNPAAPSFIHTEIGVGYWIAESQ